MSYEYSYDDFRDHRNYVDFDLRAIKQEQGNITEAVSLRQWREGHVELEFRKQGREPCFVTLQPEQMAALTELLIQRNMFKRIKMGVATDAQEIHL